MDNYLNYEPYLSILQKICDNIITINDLFNSGIKVNNKSPSCLIISMLLLNSISIARNDEMIVYVLVTDDDDSVMVKTILTYYDKEEEVIDTLLDQLNNNLRKVYNYYKTTYSENYRLNTTRLNKFLQEDIHQDLRLDLRKRRR